MGTFPWGIGAGATIGIVSVKLRGGCGFPRLLESSAGAFCNKGKKNEQVCGFWPFS